MREWLDRLFNAPTFEGDEEKTRIASLINAILLALLVLGIMLTIYSVLAGLDPVPAFLILGALFLLRFGALSLIRIGRVRLTGVLLSAVLWIAVTAVAVLDGGIGSQHLFTYVTTILIAGLTAGGSAGFVFAVLSIAASLGLIHVENAALLVQPLLPTTSAPMAKWAVLAANFALTAVLLYLATQDIVRSLQLAREGERALAESLEELEGSRAELEARSRELERRSTQLRAAGEVARDAATTAELGELLDQAVHLIRERFGFYHAGIFLVDEQREYAVLRAATGEAGQQMLERRHRLRVGEVGLVGYATGTGHPRIALDVGEDAVHFNNPFLPQTRSEMALPLRAGSEIIGALDVQSREAAAFGEDDVAVLQLMADQLAVAIANARLVQEMRNTVRELQASSGRYTREAWGTLTAGSGRPSGYRYRKLGIEPVAEQPAEARLAWRQGRPVVTPLQAEGDGDGQGSASNLAVPMKLRGETVGVLNLRFEGEPVSGETASLVEEIADRLALALENARLLEQTQRRAERDRLIADITGRVRSSMDVETILRTTVYELGAALGADRTLVQLSTSPEQGEE